MASAIVLSGPGHAPEPPEPPESNCRCTFNPRTRRYVKICRVPKSKKHRSGIAFKGNCR